MSKVNRPPLVESDEEFYRRYTVPEERKNWRLKTIERLGGYRWFASANVAKFEDYQAPGDAGLSLARLQERKREAVDRGWSEIFAKTERK